jgi:hypothetical protein
MGGYGGAMRARGFQQLAILQLCDRTLHCAFGKAGLIGQHAQAGFDRLPVLAGGAAGEIEVNQEGSRMLIVSDDIAHEHVKNVIIDWNGSVEARHDRVLPAIPIKGQHFPRLTARCHWTRPNSAP